MPYTCGIVPRFRPDRAYLDAAWELALMNGYVEEREGEMFRLTDLGCAKAAEILTENDVTIEALEEYFSDEDGDCDIHALSMSLVAYGFVWTDSLRGRVWFPGDADEPLLKQDWE
jgi:hypothetical protein